MATVPESRRRAGNESSPGSPRLDASRSRDAGGTGLGLAIARDIAANHGGRLAAAAGPGGHFTLRLPHAATTGTSSGAAGA
ncbi:hypothetical protein SXANM310S_02749 [Streptomyces xanthochromogenes]